jgi:hypothetical protein
LSTELGFAGALAAFLCLIAHVLSLRALNATWMAWFRRVTRFLPPFRTPMPDAQ